MAGGHSQLHAEARLPLPPLAHGMQCCTSTHLCANWPGQVQGTPADRSHHPAARNRDVTYFASRQVAARRWRSPSSAWTESSTTTAFLMSLLFHRPPARPGNAGQHGIRERHTRLPQFHRVRTVAGQRSAGCQAVTHAPLRATGSHYCTSLLHIPTHPYRNRRGVRVATSNTGVEHQVGPAGCQKPHAMAQSLPRPKGTRPPRHDSECCTARTGGTRAPPRHGKVAVEPRAATQRDKPTGRQSDTSGA